MRKRKTALTFWGTRGSIPSPGKNKVKYGGNTSCVELRLPDNQLVILDGGTGIRELGNALIAQKKPVHAYILLTHYHWDHIQGLPFFAPAYRKDNQLTILGAHHPQFPLSRIFSSQMESIHFPVKASSLAGHITFKELAAKNNCIANTDLQFIRANHPGTTYSYSFTFDHCKLVYMTDNEIIPGTDRAKSHITYNRQRFVDFIDGADVLIHDAQYSDKVYQRKKGWGHSPWKETVTLAGESGVKHLILFHHDPDHDDRFIDAIVTGSKSLLKKMGAPTKCSGAMEGRTVLF